MKRIVCLLAFTILLTARPASAAGYDPDHVIIVDPGNRTCAGWMEHRVAAKSDANEDVAWLYGFVSGYNVFAVKPKKAHAFFSDDGRHIADWIDKFCAKHPDKAVVAGAITFINALEKSASDIKN